MPLTIKVAGAGITVAKLLWRHGGRRGNTSARLTETLELNPGLAALGPILPLGTPVTLPDLPPAAARPRTTVPAVSIFDD